jgi:hypothetical protein
MYGTAGIVLANFAYQVVKTSSPYVFQHVAGVNKGKVTKRDGDSDFEMLVRDVVHENMETDFAQEEMKEAQAEMNTQAETIAQAEKHI